MLARLHASADGLTDDEVKARLAATGANAVRTHHADPLAVLARQLKSALLLLLLVTATVAFFLGDRTDAVIIAVILSLSVAIGFINEYRAERSVEALHAELRHLASVRRDGQWQECDVVDVVPGDIVRLDAGEVVPADVRLVTVESLECDESVLTGESLPAEKSAEPVPPGTPVADLTSCALMGTLVHHGGGEGVVVATGAATEFGRIALGLGERQEETEFQVGLRRFSTLLAVVAGILTSSIFVINLVLRRGFIEALLFSLAIAVGITPQLLPAVVATSLATGSRRLAQRKVLVKRLVCIEDLGDTEILLTDKTGTLTEGRITFERALDPAGGPADSVVALALVCNDSGGAVSAGANPLDVALADAAGSVPSPYHVVDVVPFDHDRRRVSVLADGPDGRVVIVKGAPESVVEQCVDVPASASDVLERELAEGSRVVAVAVRAAPDLARVSADDERSLSLAGFLVFLDRPKASAGEALARLANLGIAVKIVTGDHPTVAAKVCRDLGLDVAGSLTGAEMDALSDEALVRAVSHTTVFARMSPDQKSRVIKAHQAAGRDVAFLGDGVNDAIALHHADIGISVESATDVAKDAADIVLLEKDLDVLADGVVEGRRIFANTIKYVLMGTSSNFGNMFSAAAASAFLKFLPMLPSQILLNNLLYDVGQMTIPTDTVDEEQLHRPSHWDIAFIRRFMTFFGPISSLFDFLTFAVMLQVFHAGAQEFRSGWFVESLATQALVIFVIRTRRSPFWRSRPSRPLLGATAAVVAVGAVLPLSPLAHDLGFQHLPAGFYAALAGMVAAYLALAEVAKREFYRLVERPPRPPRPAARRVERRASRFSR